MKKNLLYTFRQIENCNMCGSSEDKHIVIGKRLNKSQGIRPNKKKGITTTICRCTISGLIFSNPLPIPVDIQDHYGVLSEEYWEEEYFQKGDNYFVTTIIKAKELLNFKDGMKALDVGAGIGFEMKALKNAGFDSYGIEPSNTFYEKAISIMNISPDKLSLSTIEDANYENNYFDFIVFNAVLEHLYSPSDAIKKALEWLKPNGLILIQVPSSNWLIAKLINWTYKVLMKDYVCNISPMHEPYHLYEFSLNSFKINSSSKNYEIIFHEYAVCQTFMPKIIDIILKPLMKKTNTGMELYVWLKKI